MVTDGKEHKENDTTPNKMDANKESSHAKGIPEVDDKSTPKTKKKSNKGPSQGDHYQGPRWGGNVILDCRETV